MKHIETKRFLKYMVGGGLYFWVGYTVFAICYSGLKWGWFPSKVAADAIGWSLNYLVQRFWAFSDQAHLSEMQHAGRYVFIESIGFVLDYLIIWGLKSIGITPYIGFFISAAFFTVWSYLWYKYWVFPEGKVLYHASSRLDLKIIKPHKTLSNDEYIGDYVFATANKELAVMYLASKGKATLMNTKSQPSRIIICDDEKQYIKNDKGGAVYELSPKGFQPTSQTGLSEFEKVSEQAVTPLRKNVYASSLEAMREHDITIYFVNKKIFDELVAAKDEDEIINQLKPYMA
jgi:putative flippase GtrA